MRGKDAIIALPLRWKKQCLKLSRLQTYVSLLLPIAKLIPTEEICELLSPTANVALVLPHVMCQSNLTPHTICHQLGLALSSGRNKHTICDSAHSDHEHGRRFCMQVISQGAGFISYNKTSRLDHLNTTFKAASVRFHVILVKA